jgi:hypothetical protein
MVSLLVLSFDSTSTRNTAPALVRVQHVSKIALSSCFLILDLLFCDFVLYTYCMNVAQRQLARGAVTADDDEARLGIALQMYIYVCRWHEIKLARPRL